MLLGTPRRPALHRRHLAVQFFGYFGLFCATVAILRVIGAILRNVLN